MRLLIVAYDFPPIPSPQALRWAYLSAELVRLGHEVHVLAPDVSGYGPGGLPSTDGVHLHRVFPGPIAFARRRGRGRRADPGTPAESAGQGDSLPGAFAEPDSGVDQPAAGLAGRTASPACSNRSTSQAIPASIIATFGTKAVI